MKKHVLAALALTLFATPVLAEGPEGKDREGPGGPRGPEHFISKIDGDKDGKVSKAEWQAKGDAMFNESDTNHDGFITREEAQAFHAKRMEKWKAKKAEWKAKQEASAPKAE